MMSRFFHIFLTFLVTFSFAVTMPANTVPQVIFDTDMGNDIDDVMALDMLLKYHQKGRIRLLGIMNNRDAPSATAFLDLYTSRFGMGRLPIGTVRDGFNPTPEQDSYAWKVWNMKSGDKPLFPTRRSSKDIKEAVTCYRQLLSKAADGNVIIVSVGFSTNLARLMKSAGDKYSPLNGSELLRKKVKHFCVMAGDFERRDYCEYNVQTDVPSARTFFENPPAPIYFADFLLGTRILFPAECVQHGFRWTAHHPFVEAYKVYAEMPYDRPTWDPLATLYALEPDTGFFSLSEPGTVRVSADGSIAFTPSPDGMCRYLKCSDEQCVAIRDFFVKTVSAPHQKIWKR